jgi:transcriptional regulator with GAF, ATPase, and Fis domain
MESKEVIDIDIFKAVTRAIAQSDNLEIMAAHLTQLLVGMLDIKGSSIFALNPESSELEVLASFGLSIDYMNKGPLMIKKSIRSTTKGVPTIIRDVEKTDQLQYPREAHNEGIGSIISLPIMFYGRVIGELRLYHRQPWDISEKDVDSLELLAENIGLAMMYTRLLNALQEVKETVNEVHSVWLNALAK